MSLWQAILIAAWAGISGNYFMDYLGFARPVVSGLVIGLILGDLPEGLVLGAAIEAIFLGVFTVGAALAPDYNLAGVVGVALGIASGIGVEAAVALAVPVALFGQFLNMSVVYPGNLIPLHLADRYAEEGRTRPIEMGYVLGGIFWFIKGFVPTFLAVYYGPGLVETVFNVLPGWLVEGLKIVGGLLPAVGFAMLLKVIRTNQRIWALFTAGFILASYLKLDMVAIAAIGVVVALLITTLEQGVTASEGAR